MKKDCMQFKCLISSFDLNFTFINRTILYNSHIKLNFFLPIQLGITTGIKKIKTLTPVLKHTCMKKDDCNATQNVV